MFSPTLDIDLFKYGKMPEMHKRPDTPNAACPISGYVKEPRSAVQTLLEKNPNVA